MRKALFIGILALTALAFTGCGKQDTEVLAFIADLDKTTKEIVAQVNANPTTAGLDAAQQVLDKQKPDLKARYDKLKELRGYQLSEGTTQKLTESVSNNLKSFGDLQINNAEKVVGDAAFGQKMNKLYTDFTAIFGV